MPRMPPKKATMAKAEERDKERAAAALAVLSRFVYEKRTSIAGLWIENSPSLAAAVKQEAARLKKAMSDARSLKRIFRRGET